MKDLIVLAFTAILIENVLLSQFLGVCPFIGVSKNRKNAVGMGIAVVVVIFIASIVTFGLYHLVLVKLDMQYMKTIVFILVIASLVQMIEIILKKMIPSLYKALGIYLPLITTNCAVLGVALKNINNGFNFPQMLVYSLFTGLGFLLVMFLFSVIREELAIRKVPKAFAGVPIALIVASILAILFSRYSGIQPKEKKINNNQPVISYEAKIEIRDVDINNYL